MSICLIARDLGDALLKKWVGWFPGRSQGSATVTPTPIVIAWGHGVAMAGGATAVRWRYLVCGRRGASDVAFAMGGSDGGAG